VVEHLRGQVEAERLRGQVARPEAELSAAEDRARRAEESLDGVNRDRDDWRDRHDAREAEVRALRTASGLPWWRRLISGPAPVAELEDRDS
jgi:predicted  nucleic acid-binding Zn-ribbon protein